MNADFPPSSRKTFFTVAEAHSITRRPVAVEPVKVTRSTRGSVDEHLAEPVVRRGDHVHDARRDLGVLGDDPAEVGRRPRRVGRGLEHDRVSGGERRPELAEVQIEREVPGRDRADHAGRLAAQQAPLRLAHERDVAHRPLVHVAAGELRPVRHRVDVDVALDRVGEQDRRARLGDHDRAQLLLRGLAGPRRAASGSAGGRRRWSTSRSRRRRAAPRRSRRSCRPWFRRRRRRAPLRWRDSRSRRSRRCWRRRACRRSGSGSRGSGVPGPWDLLLEGEFLLASAGHHFDQARDSSPRRGWRRSARSPSRRSPRA